MMLSGTAIGFICVIALLLASILLAVLDRREKGRGLGRLALIFFLASFTGGVVVTLLGGIQPREEHPMMMGGRPSGGAMPQMPMGGSGAVDDKELRALSEKIAANPKDLKSRERLGHLYLQQQDYENVFRLAHEALQINPHSIESRVHMGMVLFSMQDFPGAIAQMDQALSKDPHHLEALAFKGLIQLQGQDKPEEAKITWQKYLKKAKPGDVGWPMVNALIGSLSP